MSISKKQKLEKIKEIEKEEDEDEILSKKENKPKLIKADTQENIILKEIGFMKRTNLTNTHRNIVDDHIESLSTWKINKFRKLLTIVGYFISFGILFIFTYYDKTIILKLYCDRANPEDSNYVLITDYDNKCNTFQKFITKEKKTITTTNTAQIAYKRRRYGNNQ